MRNALRFLRAARTNATPRLEGGTERPAYAGSPGGAQADAGTRSTYRELQLHFEDYLTGPRALERVHAAASVLAGYGSPKLVTAGGRVVFWAEEILRAARFYWNPTAGAWGEQPSGPPDAVSTAHALLALEALAPWAAVGREALLAAEEAGQAEPAHPAELRGGCEDCHRRLEPGLVQAWEKSRHHAERVGCDACHGRNHSLIFRENGRVSPRVCGRCHAEAVEEFSASKHAAAWDTLKASALYAATPPAARSSCESCHRIGLPHEDSSRGACNHCHAGHELSAASAREPEACTGCHTGDDYPQDAAYWSSKHGALYARDRDSTTAPTCATCHHPGGRHGDGFGITIGGSGRGGALAGEATLADLTIVSPLDFAAKRAEMVGVCTACHSSRLAEESLRRADEVKREGTALLSEAARILSASQLKAPQLRVDPAAPGAEALNTFYDMWRFHYPQTWKGAYHNAPSVSNRWSRTGLEHGLARIRAEALKLPRSRQTP